MGSEMCIRDRSGNRGTGPGNAAWGNFMRVGLPCLRAERRQPSATLGCRAGLRLPCHCDHAVEKDGRDQGDLPLGCFTACESSANLPRSRWSVVTRSWSKPQVATTGRIKLLIRKGRFWPNPCRKDRGSTLPKEAQRRTLYVIEIKVGSPLRIRFLQSHLTTLFCEAIAVQQPGACLSRCRLARTAQ